MRARNGFVVCLGIHAVLAGSFYDNPEQDAGHNHAMLDEQGSYSWSKEELEQRWGQDWAFTGISTFAHLKHVRCLTESDTPFDIAIIGAPFDTAVSYRPGTLSFSITHSAPSPNLSISIPQSPSPLHFTLITYDPTPIGARFGPRAIRAASARQLPFRGFNPRAQFDPFGTPLTVLDCGDIPVTPFDNALALQQMSTAFKQLGARNVALTSPIISKGAIVQTVHPKILTLGGDHSIALPALRALHAIYGQPISVVHFDAHLDTWHPAKYPSSWPSVSNQSHFNHGSMFWLAACEGLIANGSSVHAGLRTRLSSAEDWDDDSQQGWLRISADDIDDIGVKGVVARIVERVGTERPVYLSLDIDVIDPGLAPATGTPEPGGWTSREVIRILREIGDLNVVGADVVEVAPAYDGVGEQTALAAAQVVYEILTSVVMRTFKGMEGALGGNEEHGGVRDEL